MKPKNSPNPHQQDLFRLQLSSIIDMKHKLVLLSKRIDWNTLNEQLGEFIISSTGNVALPTRLVAGLFYLQHAYGLSDEAVCAK